MTSRSNSGVSIITLLVTLHGVFGLSSNVVWGSPEEPASSAIMIPDGTPVHLYLMDDLNSKTSKKGDEVRFKVREAVRVGGIEIIQAGSPVIGHVVGVGRSSFAGHSGKLGLSIDYASTTNGAKIPLRGDATLKGEAMEQ